MSIHLTFHGAEGTVTGSCIHLQTENTQILIDCGLQQENDSLSKQSEFQFDVSEIDAVILTHGHLDHSGRVPFLVNTGFQGVIYGHYATCEIAKVIWNDCSRIHSESEQLYDESFVTAACRKCMPIGYNVPMQIKDLCFTLRDAGHILGSSSCAGGNKKKKDSFLRRCWSCKYTDHS